MSESSEAGVAPNSWLVLWTTGSDYANVDGVQYEFPTHIPNGQRLVAGDTLVASLSSKEAPDGRRVFGVGRVGSVVPAGSRRRAVFDRYATLVDPASFDELGGDPRPNSSNSINAIDPGFAKAVLALAGVSEVADLPAVVVPSNDDAVATPEPAELRDLLFEAVTKDLLGPADGPEEEIVGASVSDRYLVGQLAPRGLTIEPEEIDDGAGDADGGGEEGASEVTTPQAPTLMPSSIGLTFAVDSSVQELLVRGSWGRYERTSSETIESDAGNPKTVWKRRPMSGEIPVPLDIGDIRANSCCPRPRPRDARRGGASTQVMGAGS